MPPVGPPVPPLSTRVSHKSAVVTRSSIFFSFNCSWFSDVNGAIRFFTVVVTESKGKTVVFLVLKRLKMRTRPWLACV